MRRYFALFALMGSLLFASRAQADDTIPVRVDTRVELLSIVFRLAGAEEYNQSNSQSPYAEEVARQFGPFKAHPAVKLAEKVREEDGIGFDAVMSYAVHLKSDKWEPKIPFRSTPMALDKRWKSDKAQAFLAALKQFAADSKAERFFADHKRYYAQAAERLSAELARRPYRAWLGSFFGARPKADFCAVVGLLNGGANYGVAVRYSDGREEIRPIIGVHQFDAQGLPIFDANTDALIVHEFCHSFTNPLVDQFAKTLLPSAETIYPHRKELLYPQAYTTPITMLYESLVRACTVRFAMDNDTPANAARQLMEEQARGFFWTGELAALMGQYEQQREKYPTLQAFMPEVSAFFTRTAASIEAQMAKLPRIVSLTPANGDKNVNPEAAELRIEFDRPMNGASYAIVGDPSQTPSPANTPNGPAKPHFSADGKVFVLPIKLEPGKTYSFGINSIYRPGFRSAEGQFLDPIQVTFTTAGAK